MAEAKPGIHGPSRQETQALNRLSGKDSKGPGKLVRAGAAGLSAVAPLTGAIELVGLPPTPPAIVQEDQRVVPKILDQIQSQSPASEQGQTEQDTLKELLAQAEEKPAEQLRADLETFNRQTFNESDILGLIQERYSNLFWLVRRDPQSARGYFLSEETQSVRDQLLPLLEERADQQEIEQLIEQEVSMVGRYNAVINHQPTEGRDELLFTGQKEEVDGSLEERERVYTFFPPENMTAPANTPILVKGILFQTALFPYKEDGIKPLP